MIVFLIYIFFIHSSGCFELLLGDCPLFFAEPCNPNAVKFILSTRNGSENNLQLLNPFAPKLPAHFDRIIPLKIVVHGFGGLKIDTGSVNITKAYQEIGYNVIVVDWEPLSSIPCYPTSYLNTWHVGQCVAVLAISLMPLGIHPHYIHVLGFSLGAHVAGLAGMNLKKAIGATFYRITGLDPALPFYATLKNEWKLDPSDADFVDVIHTSAGSFGKIEATGHADFYVNGGVLQPLCYNSKYPPLCSHLMASTYFADSIRNGSKFIGYECENLASYMLGTCKFRKKALMGEDTSHLVRGIYIVNTN